MLTATQLKNNTYFLYQGEILRVLKYKHTHLGRGGANIRIKARNLKTGKVRSFNFGSNDRFEEANLEKKKLQYLYQDGEKYYFMDSKTFSQHKLDKKTVGATAKFLKEGEEASVLFWQDKPLSLELPASIIVEIKSCDPNAKGNSSVNVFKNAQTKTGLNIKVPLFIKPRDKVKIDTRTGEYIARA